MNLKAEIKALITLLWMIIRYIFVCLFWPLFRPKNLDKENFKLYFNGDIITPPGFNFVNQKLCLWVACGR